MITAKVWSRVSATDGVIGDVGAQPPKWVIGQAHPPARFVGRWAALWRLHSALSPNAGVLTSPQTPPTVVLHGPLGVGKTALAAEYVRRFGCCYPDGVVWPTAGVGIAGPHGAGYLWVLDDVAGDPEVVRRLLPGGDTPSLLVTRDPRLAVLGNAVPLADLDDRDSQLLVAAHLDREQRCDAELVEHLATAAAGSPGLRVRVAELAAADGLPATLHRLAHPTSPLTEPLGRQLLDAADEHPRDVLRVLAAASPTTVPVARIADIIAVANHTGALAIRCADPDPARAEHLRARTLTVLARAPQPGTALRRVSYDDEELRAANRIQAELVNRVPYRLHPSAARSSNGIRPGLGSIMEHVMNGLLRQFLLTWDQPLAAHEDRRPPSVSRIEHERSWAQHDQMRDELAALSVRVLETVFELAAITGDTNGLPDA